MRHRSGLCLNGPISVVKIKDNISGAKIAKKKVLRCREYGVVNKVDVRSRNYEFGVTKVTKQKLL